MEVPRFPRPAPNLASKVTEELDVTSVLAAVSPETPASRRRHAIVRGGVRLPRGGAGEVAGGEAAERRGGGKRGGAYFRGSRCFVKNLVHPRDKRSSRFPSRQRVTEFRLKMTERRDENHDSDDDVVCAVGPHRPPMGVSNSPKIDRSVQNGDAEARHQEHQELPLAALRSTGVQTCPTIPYRLRMFPSLQDPPVLVRDSSENPKKSSKICKHLRLLGRLTLCQFGLAWLLSLWAIAGAAAFYSTEGPREREQVADLATKQRDLAISLATELRQVKAEEPIWVNTIQRYFLKHENLILAAVNSGYGESGGGGGQVWTFPGCFLFAVSLLTTLGFGAPVPRTTPGRTVAVLFAAIGIPAHFLLILNTGIFLAVRLQSFAVRRKEQGGNSEDKEAVVHLEYTTIPRWVKIVPFACIGGYYLIGILCFGVGRLRPMAASLLFPLDFTAAGGLATTSGPVRIAYAIYLEGAVTIAAVAVAILQVSATQSLTNIGLKYGLLTNT
ncbi:uncharacterized protein LOC107220689 [Neodiprion lecontei]|uniref:Uncharacterized protein LOC107220689 n=1 Tax=Neodiprion lecontei TaxID=441921 RepID=A0A6J0BM31_NEOLC|nr:uncharacterized protein LOC107220689 [Neodiprion lecontei]